MFRSKEPMEPLGRRRWGRVRRSRGGGGFRQPGPELPEADFRFLLG